MLDTPVITESLAKITAVIRLTTPRERIQAVMGPGFMELAAVLQAQSLSPIGPAFSHHLRIDPALFDFELGFPLASPVQALGRVRPGSLPTCRVARVVYYGGYEGLVAGWVEFLAWLAEQEPELRPRQDLWECYVKGPETEADPAAWQTVLYKPLLD